MYSSSCLIFRIVIFSPFSSVRPPRDLDDKATITIGDKTFTVEATDLESIVELGRGAYGVVEKVRHRPSNTIMAVKVSRATVVLA